MFYFGFVLFVNPLFNSYALAYMVHSLFFTSYRGMKAFLLLLFSELDRIHDSGAFIQLLSGPVMFGILYIQFNSYAIKFIA